MALDRTGGFDVLVQVGENEINAQVTAAFAAGLLFPASLSSPVESFGLTGRLDLNLGTPVIDLDRGPRQLGITTPFSNSQLEVTAPVTRTIAPLAGTIVIVDSVQVRSQPGTQQPVVDFVDGAPTVTVSLDPATVALLNPLLAELGVSIGAAQNALAELVRDRLVEDVQRFPLSPPIDVANDADPLTPFSIEATTVNDVGAADRDALAFGVRTDSSSGGDINAIGESFIPDGSQSVLMLSNFWLLARVIRPRLAAALGRPVTDFDTPLRLNHPVPAPGGRGMLTDLEAFIEDNRIRVNGRATASGTGWSAVATFSFFIELSLSGGQLQITATSPSVHTDISLEWWVWLASIGLGALFGGIVGAIVGTIVPIVVTTVADGFADRLATDAFNQAASTIPPIPLGPLGAGMTLSSILLDDLEFRGPVQRSLGLPVKSSGEHVAAGAFALDLDAGVIYPAGGGQPCDLGWEPGFGLTAFNGAGLSVAGQPYAVLTPLQLRSFSFAVTYVPESGIPLSFDLPLFGLHSEIVLAVRTNQGHLAKVRAWRDGLSGGVLRIFWTTYDTPVPSLELALRWAETEKGEGVPFIGRDLASCERYPVARSCTVEAWPRLVTFPVDYQWCLCGEVLEEGEGEVDIAGGALAYHLQGRHLSLSTDLGDDVDCELCVSAIDSRGRELFSCVQLTRSGTETTCGPARRIYPKPSLELIPCDPLRAVASWQPVASTEVRRQLTAALGRTGTAGKGGG